MLIRWNSGIYKWEARQYQALKLIVSILGAVRRSQCRLIGEATSPRFGILRFVTYNGVHTVLRHHSAPLKNNQEFLMFCSKFQEQLYYLRSRTTTSTTEEFCILSAQVYVDAILLNKPFTTLLKSNVHTHLQ